MGVDPNWGLAGGNNALGMFQQGAQLGNQIVQQREQAEYRNALLADRQAQAQQRQAEFAAQQEDRAGKQQEAQVGKVKTMARLLSRAKDPATYAQSRAAAAQLGFDVAAIPEQYDPNWVAQQSMIVQAYQDGNGEAFSTAGKIAMDEGLQPGTPEFGQRVNQIWTAENSKSFATSPGGGVATVDPAGQARFVIQPNPGDASAGAPVGGDDDEWEVVQPGGAGGNASGGFPG